MSQVKSVDKAARLLEILLRYRRPMGLQELSLAAQCPKSTTHALLTTLREHSMVEQRPDGRYYLGIRLFECGCAVSAGWDVTQVARPHLEQLASQTGASTAVSILADGGVVSLDQCVASGGGGLQIVLETGIRMPVHATAQGKVLLAALTDSEAGSRLASQGMYAYTPHTITDRQQFMAELANIRSRGYAVEDGEHRIGLRAVAAPVYDRSGTPRYALSAVGLFRRVSSPEFQTVVRLTVDRARQLSLALGYDENDT